MLAGVRPWGMAPANEVPHGGSDSQDRTLSERAEHVFFRLFKPLREAPYKLEDIREIHGGFEANVIASMQELVDAGYYIKGERKRAWGIEPTYAPTRKGWEACESMLRKRGLRHPAIIHQAEQRPDDLALAIAVSGKMFDMNKSDYTGGANVLMELIYFYLDQIPREVVDEACESLQQRGLALRHNWSLKEDEGPDQFQATPKGEHYYNTEAVHRLGVQEGDSILELVERTSVDIFWAWQSEYGKSRGIIEEALDWAIDKINAESRPHFPVKKRLATEMGDGALRIDVALQDRIQAADFFVGDFTAVHEYENRLRVNENVLIEAGFALASKEPQEIVLIAIRRDDKLEWKTAQRAFDIRHVRCPLFGKDEKKRLRSYLFNELVTAMRRKELLRKEG